MFLEAWGASSEEVNGPVVGDHLCPDAHVSATRCITISKPPHVVFPWIRQMGFGRAGWYSYDWLDNLGRRSARGINPDWQDVSAGSRIPAGPTAFIAAIVDEPTAFVLTTSPHGVGKRLAFTLAYELREHPEGTRLVTRMRARINVPGGRQVAKCLLSPGDGIMVRKQLKTLRQVIPQ